MPPANRRKPRPEMVPDREPSELEPDPEYPDLAGISRGREALDRFRQMGLPEPTQEMKATLHRFSRRAWEDRGPGALYMVWGQTDDDDNDIIAFVNREVMEQVGMAEGLIAAAENEWTKIDPVLSFVLIMVFPTMNHLFTVRVFTLGPPPGEGPPPLPVLTV